jgi:hypothetical protein
MEHKLAKLLRQAADDADARFYCDYKNGYGCVDADIKFVISHPNYEWKLSQKLVEKPDPYAELKKAYAEGKSIETRFVDMGAWQETFTPTWNSEQEYRIKPQTVTKWLWANSDGGISEIMMTEANYGYGIKLEWSKTDFEVAE